MLIVIFFGMVANLSSSQTTTKNLLGKLVSLISLCNKVYLSENKFFLAEVDFVFYLEIKQLQQL